VPGLAAGELDAVLAQGLGLDLGRIRETAAKLGVVGALAAQPLPMAQLEQRPVLEGPELGQLRLAAEADVARVANVAVEGDIGEIPLRRAPKKRGPEAAPQPRKRRKRDALDRVLKDLS
jgi:hypothetical protein